MYSKWNQDYSPLAKRLVLVAFLLCVTTGLKASPLYYSYEGVITGFNSFNDMVTLDDYDIELGQTAVSYVFEIDFDRNTSTSGGAYQRYYSDLLIGGIVNGELMEDNESYNVVFDNFNSQGHMQGGSRVDISTTDDITNSWKIEDWYIGQSLRLLDGGYLSTGTGGAVYFFGDVELTSISNINPVPVPGALILFVSALGFLRLSQHLKRS